MTQAGLGSAVGSCLWANSTAVPAFVKHEGR